MTERKSKRRRRAPNGAPKKFIEDHVTSSISDCIMWPYSTDRDGYPGSFRVGDGVVSGHRYMCILAHGAPPFEGAEAAHSCGSTGCVNPNHIRWATTKENIADKNIHGTMSRGEGHYKAKLTGQQVLLIYKDERPTKVVAAEYGVSISTIEYIWSGMSWAWLTGHKRAA